MPFTIRDKKTGKTYKWSGPKAPTPLEAKQFIWEQENSLSAKAGRVWDKMNEPLTDVFSRGAKEFNESGLFDVGLDEHIPEALRVPWAQIKGFHKGAMEGTGNLLDSFTSPFSLGTSALTLGASGAARAGLAGGSRALTNAARAVSAIPTAHGTYRAGKGAVEGDLGEIGAGALEAGIGALGLKTPYPEVNLGKPKPPRLRLGGRVAPKAPPRKGPILDADFTVVEPESPIGPLPPMDESRGLPPAQRTFYGGRYGTAVDDIDLPETPPRRIISGGRTKPKIEIGDITQTDPLSEKMIIRPPGPRDILEQNSPYGMNFRRRGEEAIPELDNAVNHPIENMVEEIPTTSRTPTSHERPYAKASDGDVGFFVEQGDKDAIAEARLRPGLWESLKTWAKSNPALQRIMSNEKGFIKVGPFQKDPFEGGADDVAKKIEEAFDSALGNEGDTAFEKGLKGDALENEKWRGLITGADYYADTFGVDPKEFRQYIMNKTGAKTWEELKATALPEAYSGEERRVMDFGPAQGQKDRRPPSMKQPTPSPTRLKEIYAKFGKVMSDERGFINIGGGKPPKNPFNPAKGTPYEEKFSNWVNNVRAAKVEGILKGTEFKDLDNLGMGAFSAFQSGSRTGRLKDVANYFDAKFQELKAKGVPLNYRENYIPQIWADDPAKVQQVYRRLGLKPGFTLERVFENYSEGINAGLKPKFNTISELVGWYERKANKAIYDREFYEMGKQLGWIKPQGKGGPDWKVLDPNHFPFVKVKIRGSNEVRTLPMTAPPELHELVTNYLDEPNKIMDWMANMSSLSKNFAMSAGVPFTGANAHGYNILSRTIKGNPKAALKNARYIFNPAAAQRALDQALPTAPWAVKHGLTLTTEGYELGAGGSSNLVKSSPLQKVLKLQGKMFEDPLFQQIIPALKLKHFNDMTDDLIRSGMGRDAAGKQAAEFTNNLYGGINWEAMGRSRDLQNLARMTVLAPDWLETNVRIGGGLAKNLKNPRSPQGRYYARMARNLIGSYVAADVVNYAMTGRHMFENEPGHALDIDLGKSGEKERWLRPWGTGADYLRLPFDMAAAAVRHTSSGKWEPDFGSASTIAKNRLSIPLSTGMNFLSKRDDFGRPFLGRDDYGRMIPPGKQATGAISELGDLFLPPYIRSMTDYASGRASGEQAITGAIESPIRYSTRRKPRRRSAPSR